MSFDKYQNTHILAPAFLDINTRKTYLSRRDFADPVLHRKVSEQLANGEDILFLPNDVADYYGSRLILIGTLESGAKASVLLDNVPHCFDIFPMKLIHCDTVVAMNKIETLNLQILKNINPEMTEFISEFQKLRVDPVFNLTRFEIITRKIYNIGQFDQIGIRLFFATAKIRNSALTRCYSDELFFITSNYSSIVNSAFIMYNKFSSFWMRLTNYRTQASNKWYGPSTKLEYNFELDFHCYKNVTDTSIYTNPGHNLIATLDIETCEVKDDEDDLVSGILNDANKIFNARFSIADTAKDKKELLSIGIFRPCVEKYLKLDSHGLNIVCKTQKEVILCIAEVFARLSPDILLTYNGNCFDIPLILLQARLEGVFEQFYCTTSVLSSESWPIKGYFKNPNGVYVSNANYTLWSKIATTSTISGLDDKSGLRIQQRLKKFKVENDREEYYHYWSPFGCINIDLLLIAKKAYPKSNHRKLSDVLKKKGIEESKHDLSYDEIWRRWRRSGEYFTNQTPGQLRELSEIDIYCAQDCYCTYLLLCAFMLLPQKRAMCKYTSLPLYTVIYLADGEKVVAGVSKLCAKKGYSFIERYIATTDKLYNCKHLKYHIQPKNAYNQGALVNIFKSGIIHIVHPIYGIVKMPIEAIDAQSLYPSIMILLNLSPECFVFSDPQSDKYQKLYLPDLPEDIIHVLNIKDNTVWAKKHFNISLNYGIIPTYLDTLFTDRIIVKEKIADCHKRRNKIREDFEKQYPRSTFVGDYLKFLDENINPEYHELENLANTYDAEQLTIKIKMNTIYGCTKYDKNALFCYLIAHLTTKTGREIITFTNDLVIAAGKTPCYNDTDSVYFYHQIELFEDILAKGQDHPKYHKRMVHRSMKLSFGRAKLIDWYTNKYYKLHNIKNGKKLTYDELVEITRNERFHKSVLKIPEVGFNDYINNELELHYGSNRIKFVREETSYPHMILMKKKYFGMKHEWSFVPDIIEKNLLIKGVSSVARNISSFLRDFNNTIMIDILTSPSVDVEDIIFDKMKLMYNTLYEPEKYAKHFTYKPNVKNGLIPDFVARMTDLNKIDSTLYTIPDPLEVIDLVYTRPNKYLCLSGASKKQAKSELYEYTHVVKAKELIINRDDYLKSLYSICSQLLTYKKLDFYDPEMSVKRYKDLMEKQYVIPYFTKYLSMQPHNIALQYDIDHTKSLLLNTLPYIYRYFEEKYPTISDLLIFISRNSTKSAYDRLIKKVITISTNGKLNTSLSVMSFYALSKNKLLTLDTIELDTMMNLIFPKYKIFIDSFYERMENMFMKLVTSEITDFTQVELLDDIEFEVLTELRLNILKYITMYKYTVKTFASRI